MYLEILSRKLSTSSKTLGDKKLEKSVEPGDKESGGICCRAFLEEEQEEQYPIRNEQDNEQQDKKTLPWFRTKKGSPATKQ